MEDGNDLDATLRAIYYDPKNPAGFASSLKLYETAKTVEPNITHKNVKKWLSGELAYTLHKPARRNYTRNRIIVTRIDQQWQADLADMQEFSGQNNGFRYILTVIDCLSKYAWAVPLKTKTGKAITDAFKQIIGERKPTHLQTDRGTEFMNSTFQLFLQSQDINYFTSLNDTTKCAIVERFNRTLKSRMFKYFTSKGTRRYIDILQDCVDAYNSSKHSSIKMRPVDVNYNNDQVAFRNLYKVNTYRELLRNKKPKLEEGATVRQQYPLKPFDKGYYPLWTDTVFKVDQGIKGTEKPMYHVEDPAGDVVKRRYYPEELQKIESSLYRVEAILRTRIHRNGRKEHLVKWLNYPDSYNSWIPDSDIVNL